jgi:S1-C subfamily serine protease
VAAGGGDGPRPYFGSIPDMAAEPAGGLRLAGVTTGGPAEQAGLRAGDVVVEFGGAKITDLYTYNDALNAHKPGEVVTVIVQRPGANGAAPERLSFSVTLGRRGQ